MCWLVDSNYYYLDYKSSALPIKPNQLSSPPRAERAG